MAARRAGVGIRASRLGDELPVVARSVQAQLQHPTGVELAGSAVRLDRAPGRLEALSAGADDDSDAACVPGPVGPLREERFRPAQPCGFRSTLSS